MLNLKKTMLTSARPVQLLTSARLNAGPEICKGGCSATWGGGHLSG